MEWIFDPLAPSGSRLGGVPQAWVFEPELDIFVREVLQNSRDQRIKSSKRPARVKFSLMELSGTRKDAFLQALDWRSLKPHLTGVAKTRTSMAKPISSALKRISKSPLLVLRISDFGTVGLTGGEDEELTNFTSLCKNVLSTAEDEGNRVRGGSYGLGKAVLWRFSSISTVLFSSNLDQNKKNRFRLFARSELCSHSVGSENFQGYGWFGKVSKGFQGRGQRAVSAWDKEAEHVAADLLLARDPALGTGTSIAVVGFKLPAADEDPSSVEIAEQIARSAARWFWPSLLRANPTLEVDVEAVDASGDVIFSTSASETAEVRPFVHAYFGAATSEKAVKVDQVAEKQIELCVPENVALTEPGDQAEALVKVYRASTAYKSSQYAQHVALVRGSEMVVKYLRPSGIIADDFPFFGAVRVGHARTLGEQVSTADDRAERFLRAAEPPSHNDWKLTSRVGEEYARGAGTRIAAFLKDIATAVRELCEPTVSEGKSGPDLLARLFPIGDTGTPSGPREYTVTGLRANFKGGQWKFAGRVKRKPLRRGSKPRPWTVTVTVFQNSESGRPGSEDVIDIKTFSATNGELVEQNGSVTWLVPAKCSDLVFQGSTAKFAQEQRLADLRRTSVTVQVVATSKSDLAS